LGDALMVFLTDCICFSKFFMMFFVLIIFLWCCFFNC